MSAPTVEVGTITISEVAHEATKEPDDSKITLWGLKNSEVHLSNVELKVDSYKPFSIKLHYFRVTKGRVILLDGTYLEPNGKYGDSYGKPDPSYFYTSCAYMAGKILNYNNGEKKISVCAFDFS
jgi:hypothetical protein